MCAQTSGRRERDHVISVFAKWSSRSPRAPVLCIFFSTLAALSLSSLQSQDVCNFWAALTSLLIIGMRRRGPFNHWDHQANTGLFYFPVYKSGCPQPEKKRKKQRNSTADGSNEFRPTRTARRRPFPRTPVSRDEQRSTNSSERSARSFTDRKNKDGTER